MHQFFCFLILVFPVITYAGTTNYTLRASSLWGSSGNITTRPAGIEILNSATALYNISALENNYDSNYGLDYISTKGNFSNSKSVVTWVYKTNNPSLNSCGEWLCNINTKDKNGSTAFFSDYTLNDRTPAKLEFANIVNLRFTIYGPNGPAYGAVQMYTCNNVTVGHGGRNWWIFNNYPPGYIFDGMLPAVGSHQLLCTNLQNKYNVLKLSVSGNANLIHFKPLYNDYSMH